MWLLLTGGEFESIIQIISNVGFPIALCVYVLYLMDKRDKAHDAKESEFAAAMQENAKALSELSTMIKEMKNNG